MIPEAAVPYSVGFATFIFGVTNGGPIYDAGVTALLFGLAIFVIGRLFRALDSKREKGTSDLLYQILLSNKCDAKDCPIINLLMGKKDDSTKRDK